jgi:hypothetical protein
VLSACTGRPIPLAVRRGSTFVLPLSADTFEFNLGYESEITRQLGLGDPQRGALELVLRHPTTGQQHALVTRFVTRAWPDPASPAGIRNGLAGGVLAGQVVAVIDVPLSVPAGDYALEARRLWRDPRNPTAPPVQDAVFFWNQPPPDLGTLTVLAGTGSPTPSDFLYSSLSIDGRDALADLVPHPRLELGFAHWLAYLDSTPPAAAEIVLGYPAQKVEVLTVYEEGHLGRRSVVRWSDDRAAERVTIQFANPDRDVLGLAVGFRLVDPAATGPATPADFQVVASTVYDENGVAPAGQLAVPGVQIGGIR